MKIRISVVSAEKDHGIYLHGSDEKLVRQQSKKK